MTNAREASPVVLLSGTSNPGLAERLSVELGLTLSARTIDRFPDGEMRVQLQEDLRGRDVFILQSLRAPVGDHLLELLLLADACRRSGAARITAVLPYLAYARQDRRESTGVPLGARVVADALGRAVDGAIVVDLHSAAVEGCFSVPVEQVSCMKLLADRVKTTLPENSVVVSPDLGAAKRSEKFARALGESGGVAIVHKTRLTGSEVEAGGVVGRVAGRSPIVVDDIISTAGTIEAAVGALLEAGCAREHVTVCATHGLFVPPAPDRLRGLPLRRVIVTDSVPPPSDLPFELEVVSIAPLLADAIRRMSDARR